MRAERRRVVLRWLEQTLFALAVVCLAYYGYQTIEARQVQQEQAAAFEALLESSRPAAPLAPPTTVVAERVALPQDDAPAAPAPRRRLPATGPAGDVLALLEIPRLQLASTIVSGDSDDVLDVAIGHLPDTPKPWEAGNSALAAHRDGLFRPLRHIRLGDEIRVRSQHGDILYRVSETRIVTPDDLSVLAPTTSQTLTLITCYPFNFIGNAPKRFIVHAQRINAEQE